MTAESSSWGDYVTATFSRDFAAEGVDYDTAAQIHRGVVDEWRVALARSGLFTNRAVAEAARCWQNNPSSLLDALLADADEMTVKRYRTVWDTLDRTAGQADSIRTAARYA
ncbi:hypothetical protein QT969_17170 [Rhodococcus sp. CSLK01-03]|uniref:Uncharacterized protein n=2 Tax=Rhodococcus TaxID=1827 RepID=A0A0M8PBD6_RHORH|nr:MULTISPECIES: hypothetical protein [Rhodococcus]KOS53114.1 hypothetical protein Z051_27330 [Rhodococcus rhodochrous KG-21]MDM7490013.1 hypothetical protein [Rhodococcus indonesiensis]